jgi:hypothetical protein
MYLHGCRQVWGIGAAIRKWEETKRKGSLCLQLPLQCPRTLSSAHTTPQVQGRGTYHFVSKFTERLHSGASSSKLKFSKEKALKMPFKAGGQSKLKPANMDSTWTKSYMRGQPSAARERDTAGGSFMHQKRESMPIKLHHTHKHAALVA